MYHYIIDQTRIPPRRADKILGEVYGHLTEFQVSGEFHRVTRLRNLHDLVEVALRSQARTIVAIGDDQTFLEMVEILLTRENIVVGFIPLTREKESEIARILGLGGLAQACKAIAQRRVQEFDLGQVNRNHFFTSLTFGLLAGESPQAGFFSSLNAISRMQALNKLPVTIRVDGKYTLRAEITAGAIINNRVPNRSKLGAGQDGKLDLALIGKLGSKVLLKHRRDLLSGQYELIAGATILQGVAFEIDGPKNMSVFAGPLDIKRLPLRVTVAADKLRAIIGKGRKG